MEENKNMGYVLRNARDAFLKFILPSVVIFFSALVSKADLVGVSETWSAFIKSGRPFAGVLIAILCLVIIQKSFKKTYLTILVGLVALTIFISSFEPIISSRLLN